MKRSLSMMLLAVIIDHVAAAVSKVMLDTDVRSSAAPVVSTLICRTRLVSCADFWTTSSRNGAP